jgi:hypothetical protein
MRRLFSAMFFLACLSMPAEADDAGQSKAEDPTVENVIASYIDALGGREALAALSNRVCTGRMVTDFSDREHPVYESQDMEVHTRAPEDFHLRIWSDDGGYSEAFDGKAGWVKDKCGVRADSNAGRGKLAFLLNPQGGLAIDSYFHGLIYAGESDIDGRSVFVLQPTSLSPEHYTLYFDKGTGLLVAIGYYWRIEDYREVDGVMFPHRISTSRKGGSTIYELNTVVHNADIPDSLFAMPETLE